VTTTANGNGHAAVATDTTRDLHPAWVDIDAEAPTAEAQPSVREAMFDSGAEQVVLGSMMLDPSVSPDVAALLKPGDFYRPAHATVYTALLDLESRRMPTDPVAVAAYLSDRGDLTRVGGAAYLHTLQASVPVSMQAMHYARIVAGKAILRHLLAAAKRIEQIAASSPHDQAASALDAARALLADLDAPSVDEGPVRWRDIALTVLDDTADGEAQEDVFPTGFFDLDRLLGGGLRTSQLVLVAGRPGLGKSTAAAGDLVRHTAFTQRREPQPTVVFSLEMSEREIVQRLISAEARVPLHDIRSGNLSDNDLTKAARMVGDTEDAPLWIDTTPNLTVADIRARCRRLKGKHGLKVVVVDQVSLVTAAKGTGRETREQQVAAMTRALKLMAKELDVVVVAVFQLNRGPEQRSDKRPQLSDLRETGAAEQDADIVILLHRDDYYDKESPRAGEADFIVAKHRNGPTDTITVAAQLHLSRFVDMAVV
jgi:replicative DNA helicase